MKNVLPPAKKTLATNAQQLNKHDFKLLANLGEGSFGKVYKVEHIPTGAHYAIKVMAKEKLKNPKMLKQVQTEISIMESVSHKNIVDLVTYFENDANIYLVLELGGVNPFD
jgi:serine/threonine protein kinase